jgi:hypothetical protein
MVTVTVNALLLNKHLLDGNRLLSVSATAMVTVTVINRGLAWVVHFPSGCVA